MKLAEYLNKYSVTHRALADKVGVSRVQITNIVNKKNYASAMLMKKIIQATDGKVTYEDLIENE